MKKIPEEIDPCPIYDSVVEIRFHSKIEPHAIFGVIYNELKDDLNEVSKLPILQLPDQVREQDPNLKNKPHYKISGNGYSLQIGPNVLTFSPPFPYVGWNNFSERLFDYFNRIFNLPVIDKVQRIGIRYINFFELNIFEKIDLGIFLKDKPLVNESSIIKTEIINKDFKNTLQVSNDVTLTIEGENRNGSIIDIDTYQEFDKELMIDDFKKIIEKGHQVEKEIFFNLLQEDFLESLNPKY